MTLWEERAARNEALFREVNEQVRSLSDQFASDTGTVGFVCECSRDDCAERLELPIAVYEAVRAHPRRFLVVPGHDGDFEHVVERSLGYVIVEKEGDAGRIAQRTDPRK
jgi:hypothetical protein